MANSLIPIELVEQVSRKGCVLFLGWSYNTPKLGDLTDKILSQKLSERIGFNDPSKTLAEVAEYFEAQRGFNALSQYVYDVITEHDNIPTFYKNILKLPFNIVISTTLDNYVKRALLDLGEKFHYIIRDEEIPFIENDNDSKVIVKLYGDIENRSSMIITREQHIDFFAKLPSISDLLKYYFSTMTLVFLGCDLDDPYFSQLYAYTNQRIKGYQKRAFAIIPGANDYQKTIWGKKNLTILDMGLDLFAEELKNSIQHFSLGQHKPVLNPEPPTALKAPYKFLSNFEEEDVDIFYGRSKEINQTLHKLLSSKLMVIYGKSGFGKTSLIKAGIIPILIKNDYLPSYARCSIDPILSIKSSIVDRLSNDFVSETILNKLRSIEGVPLIDFIVEFNKLQSKRLVIIVDQFEEFFISLGTETKDQFIRSLRECVNSSLDVTFLLSLREDFLADLQDDKGLKSLVSDSYRLKALSSKAAQDAVQEPARKFGLTVDSQVVDNIIDELSDKGQVDPAQLQIVCDCLYNRLAESSQRIDKKLYEEVGGVKQILTDYLDEILFGFGAKRMAAAQKILRNMVTSWYTRVPITYAETLLHTNDIPQWSEADTRELLADLIKVRLIRRMIDTSEESYELTHEFLINKVREWIDLEQLKVKEALDLLRQELNNWQRHQMLMDKSKLMIVDSRREKLMLDNKHKAFILIAASQYDFEFDYWLKRNEGNPLVVNHLIKLLISTDNNLAKNLAGLGVCAFSPDGNTLDQILHTYETVANPHTIKRISELNTKGFLFPEGFREKVANLVTTRFTKFMTSIPAGKSVMGTLKERIVEYINIDLKKKIWKIGLCKTRGTSYP